MGKTFRCLGHTLLGIGLMLVSVQAAFAHQDPPTATGTAVLLSMTAYRGDQTTPIGGGSVTQCETIYYETTLSWGGGANAAIELGSLHIITPDSVDHDVTPAGGIPCLGGTFNDPNSATTGQCAGAGTSVTSAKVLFQVNISNANCTASTKINASAVYKDGIAHNGTTDQTGVGGNIPFQDPVSCCVNDTLVCNGTSICDPARQDGVHLGSCAPPVPITCNDDGNVCNGPEHCTEPGGTCVSGPPLVCNDDGNVCNGPEHCDPTLGCVSGPPLTCNDDGNQCNGPESCDTTNGCVSGPPIVCADPVCTACIPANTNGICDPIVPTPPECVPSNVICRTPGFWGTHGGTEKLGSQNITQIVLDEIQPLIICGHLVSTTDLTNTSAVEAICVSPKGDSTLQLARQLTAAALNCGVTNSKSCGGGGQTPGDVCSGVTTDSTSIADLFNTCNAVCADPTSTKAEITNCIDALDCFNNGGTGLVDSVCSGDSGCHERSLNNGCFTTFEPPGPAGSPRKCNDARKDDCTIFCSVACNNLVACPP